MPMQMTFRSGKVTISMAGENQAGECWFGNGKIYVSIPGEDGIMELDLNDDGSLQGPLGVEKESQVSIKRLLEPQGVSGDPPCAASTITSIGSDSLSGIFGRSPMKAGVAGSGST
jgi:hypothetical protein